MKENVREFIEGTRSSHERGLNHCKMMSRILKITSSAAKDGANVQDGLDEPIRHLKKAAVGIKVSVNKAEKALNEIYEDGFELGEDPKSQLLGLFEEIMDARLERNKGDEPGKGDK